uniref:Uncharacterized protein n=1 Tax=Anopheles dirus TaxID=7168 RepID=A0A182NEX6_9DIPT
MKFFLIDNPREVIPIGCRLLKLFGLDRGEKLKPVYWTHCVLYVLFSVIPRGLLEINDTVMLLRLGSELAFVCCLFFQKLALYFRRRHLYRLVDMLQMCMDKPYSDEIDTFIVRSNAKINKSSVTCCKYFLLAFISYCLVPPIASFAVYVRNARNDTGIQEEYIISTEMNMYYLDIRYNLLHYSIFTGTIWVLTVTSCLTLCTKDVVDMSVMKATTLMFQVTAMQIRELRGRISQAQLATVIDSHRDTLLCAQHLQHALNLSLLVQLTFCSAIWCLMLLYVLLMGFDSRILNILILLIIVTIETYAYCKLGTQLTDKGEDVLMALQQLAWYDQSVAIQKQIIFMIRRSQKPIVLTAGKLFYANVLQFSEM